MVAQRLVCCTVILILALGLPSLEAISKAQGQHLVSSKTFYFKRSWPENVVPYEISPTFGKDGMKKIRSAMDEVQRTSCVVFKPVGQVHKKGSTGILKIVKNEGDGCKTSSPEMQEEFHKNPEISLDPSWCLEHGRIIHELMHALGFTHEHQRPDRDKHIIIMWENIKEDQASQFSKSNYPMELTYGFPYDMTSVMHYANWSDHAAIDPKKPIILPKVQTRSSEMGQRKGLNRMDIAKLNFAYKCNES